MQTNYTFEQLPAAVGEILSRLDGIDAALQGLNKPTPEVPKYLNIKQVAKMLHLSVATIYGLVHRNSIPYHKAANGRKLYFDSAEIENWINNNKA